MKGWMRPANRGSRGAEEAGEEKRPSLHPAPNPFPRGGGCLTLLQGRPLRGSDRSGMVPEPPSHLTGVGEGPLQVMGLQLNPNCQPGKLAVPSPDRDYPPSFEAEVSHPAGAGGGKPRGAPERPPAAPPGQGCFHLAMGRGFHLTRAGEHGTSLTHPIESKLQLSAGGLEPFTYSVKTRRTIWDTIYGSNKEAQ